MSERKEKRTDLSNLLKTNLTTSRLVNEPWVSQLIQRSKGVPRVQEELGDREVVRDGRKRTDGGSELHEKSDDEGRIGRRTTKS